MYAGVTTEGLRFVFAGRLRCLGWAGKVIASTQNVRHLCTDTKVAVLEVNVSSYQHHKRSAQVVQRLGSASFQVRRSRLPINNPCRLRRMSDITLPYCTDMALLDCV